MAAIAVAVASSETKVSGLDDDFGSKPNIVLMLVDDVGWSGVGWHKTGSDVSTPTLDELVSKGVDLRRHYSFNWCAPSRAALMTGRLKQFANPNGGPSDWEPDGDVHLGYDLMPATLARAGYATHMVGKWHLGHSSISQTPVGRGFETYLGYLGGAESHWGHSYSHGDGVTKKSSKKKRIRVNFKDFWIANAKKGIHEPARGYEGIYGDMIFTDEAVRIIHHHATAEKRPLFLFVSFQSNHDPLEAPEHILTQYEVQCAAQNEAYGAWKVGDVCDANLKRRVHNAMSTVLDTAARNITNALKRPRDVTVKSNQIKSNQIKKRKKAGERREALWDNTVMVWISDNGGATHVNYCAGNNYPLLGGKHSNFEGGVRTVGFVAGGGLPEGVRGTRLGLDTARNTVGPGDLGLVSIVDWYATFMHLAGIPATSHPEGPGAEVYLPALDSINMWPFIASLASSRSPRTEVPFEHNVLPDHSRIGAIITGRYKWIRHSGKSFGTRSGPIYPNGSTSKKECPMNIRGDKTCKSAKGCLFDIFKDPLETTNLIDIDAVQPALVQILQRFDEYVERGERWAWVLREGAANATRQTCGAVCSKNKTDITLFERRAILTPEERIPILGPGDCRLASQARIVHNGGFIGPWCNGKYGGFGDPEKPLKKRQWR